MHGNRKKLKLKVKISYNYLTIAFVISCQQLLRTKYIGILTDTSFRLLHTLNSTNTHQTV